MLRTAKRNAKSKVTGLQGLKRVPAYLKSVRIPPAWEDVMVSDTENADVYATGVDAAGRLQRLYSPQFTAKSAANKYRRIEAMIQEKEAIRSEIELDIKSRTLSPKDREAAIVLYLIYETGIRPGSNTDTRAQVKAYGATTIQLRHIKITSEKRVRLQFTGKKGVRQNVLVTNPWLVEELKRRKEATTAWSETVFDVSTTKLNQYASKYGYSAKDFRTMRGTITAMDLLCGRSIPKQKTKAKKVFNAALDQVAKKLGNTRAIARNSYVAPWVQKPWVDRITGVN